MLALLGIWGDIMVFFCGKNVDIQLPGFNQEEWCFNQRDCWYGDIKQDDIMGYPWEYVWIS